MSAFSCPDDDMITLGDGLLTVDQLAAGTAFVRGSQQASRDPSGSPLAKSDDEAEYEYHRAWRALHGYPIPLDEQGSAKVWCPGCLCRTSSTLTLSGLVFGGRSVRPYRRKAVV